MRLLNLFRRPSKDVALVLSGGGARGYAHIGAIEALEACGYRITSISGTSMGALIGGCYAAGILPEVKARALALTRKDAMQLMDVSPGLDHIATGDRLSRLLNELLHGVRIEDLPIPFACCASDIVSGREEVFRRGPLSEAIRASISIPCFFKPVRRGNAIYVDGSVHNTLPLNRVERHKGDRLVAVNVSGPFSEPYDAFHAKATPAEGSIESKLRKFLPFMKTPLSANVLNLAMRVTEMSVLNNTEMTMALTPPDILVSIPTDSYGILDFDKAAPIIEMGREEMMKEISK